MRSKIIITASCIVMAAIFTSRDPGFIARAPFCLAAYHMSILEVDEYMKCGLTGWRMSDLITLYKRAVS